MYYAAPMESQIGLRDERNRLRIKSHGGDLYRAPRRGGSILAIHIGASPKTAGARRAYFDGENEKTSEIRRRESRGTVQF